jgi:hypothetical protein
MLDVQHHACTAALIAHLRRGHKKFAGLEALDHVLGGESLDGLPVNVMDWSELGVAHIWKRTS